jgi:hypothetical protein
MQLIVTPFFRELTEEIMQDCAPTHTANISITAPQEVFVKLVKSLRLGPARSPGLIMCNYYLWSAVII